MTNLCLYCNKKYKDKPCRIKSGRAKFCSRKCKDNSQIGKPAWNKGIKRWWSSPTEYKKGHKQTKNWYIAISKLKNENNKAWKGENVGYVALHAWVKRYLGIPDFCESCCKNDRRRYEWANKSGKYKRDLNDWVRLCVPCHRKHDIQIRKNYGIRQLYKQSRHSNSDSG